jgi:competence protein ComEA
VNLNRANLFELDGLPGVGPVLAARIVEWRSKNGNFKSVDELRRVSGIGNAKFNELKEVVVV